MKSGNNIVAGTYDYGIYISANNGDTWTQTNLNNRVVVSSAVSGNKILAGTFTYGLYISDDAGYSWIQSSLNNVPVYSTAINGNNFYAGAYNGIYVSTNSGSTWTQNAPTILQTNCLAISGSKIIAGNGDGIYISTNNGTNWTLSPVNNSIYSVAVLGNDIYAGSAVLTGVFRSTDNGTSWVQTSLNNQQVGTLLVDGDNIFAGTYNGVYLTTDFGTTWYNKNQGFPYPFNVKSLVISNNYIYAGTYGNSVWRRSLSEILGIQNISTETPTAYSLGQNYPNPFNPTTKIKFDIATDSRFRGNDPPRVVLKVYDVMGREVQTLVNESLKPGTYEVSFDGSALNSGVYFYKLITNGYTETRKMLLLK